MYIVLSGLCGEFQYQANSPYEKQRWPDYHDTYGHMVTRVPTGAFFGNLNLENTSPEATSAVVVTESQILKVRSAPALGCCRWLWCAWRRFFRCGCGSCRCSYSYSDWGVHLPGEGTAPTCLLIATRRKAHHPDAQNSAAFRQLSCNTLDNLQYVT